MGSNRRYDLPEYTLRLHHGQSITALVGSGAIASLAASVASPYVRPTVIDLIVTAFELQIFARDLIETPLPPS
jgi:hypothetical protein